MADATHLATYLLVTPDPSDLPNSYQLAVDPSFSLTDAGAGSTLTLGLNTTSNLGRLSAFNTPGLLTCNGNSHFYGRSVVSSDASINVSALEGCINLTVSDSTIIPGEVTIQVSGSTIGTSENINFDPGNFVTFGMVNNTASNRIDFTIASTDPGIGQSWSLFQAQTTVNMATYNMENITNVAFSPSLPPTLNQNPSAAMYMSSVDQLPYWMKFNGVGHNIVTCATTNYGGLSTILLGNGTDYTPLVGGTATYVLTSNSSGDAPSWQALSPPTTWWSISIGGGNNPYYPTYPSSSNTAMDCNSNSINRCRNLNVKNLIQFSNTPLPNQQFPLLYYNQVGSPKLILLSILSPNGAPGSAWMVGTTTTAQESDVDAPTPAGSFVIGNGVNGSGYTLFNSPTVIPLANQFNYLTYKRFTTLIAGYEWSPPKASMPFGNGTVTLANTTVGSVALGDGTYFVEDENVTDETVILASPQGDMVSENTARGPATVLLNTHEGSGLPVGFIIIGDGANDNGRKICYSIMQYQNVSS